MFEIVPPPERALGLGCGFSFYIRLHLHWSRAELLPGTITGGAGLTHAVTVAAESLYEAAARGIAEFKRTGFALAEIGPATRLTITVESPRTEHELPVAKLDSWLATNGKTPREQAMKVTLVGAGVAAARHAIVPARHRQGDQRRTGPEGPGGLRPYSTARDERRASMRSRRWPGMYEAVCGRRRNMLRQTSGTP
jgi:hypothetical protein